MASAPSASGTSSPGGLVSFEEIQLRAGGLRLAARAFGPVDGQRVLGLHGWLDNAASFDRLAPLLDGIRLVALDLPGHGLSEHRPESACYDFITWIKDVLEAADALGWDRFSLLGHSLGGGIASCVAGTVPDRMDRVVLLDTFGPITAEASEAPARLEAALTENARLSRRPARIYPSLGDAAAVLTLAIAGLSEEAALLLASRGTAPAPQGGGIVWRRDARLRAGSLLRLTEAHVEAFFRRATCPVLVVRARDGWPFEAAGMQRRLTHLQGATLLEVEGGHHVHLVHPERVADPVRTFLLHA